jgi:3-hydroxyisobutyrate dehydrogenase-like beta-hydroxyacid dehydrogenase
MSSITRITHQTPLGFIGLGYLGSRIARRLAAAGFPMVVYDRNRTKANELSAPGVKIASNACGLARDVDVVLSCLTDDTAVEAVYLGAGSVLENVRSGGTIIDLSTVAPETSRRIHRAGREFGISVLDVAVSGSTPAADAGNLTLFGGGAGTDFEACTAIFAAIANQWFYMGPSGSGTAMKLVVNALLGVGMQAIAESAALGDRLGLRRDLFFDVLAKTAVVAPAHAGKLASAKRSDYTPQFPIRLMHKDFRLVLDAATRLGLVMPATEAAAAVNAAETAGDREEDFSAVVRRMELQSDEEGPLPPAA